MGYEVWYCADSMVYHVGGGSLPYGNARKTFLNFRNSLFMMLKNLPARKLLPVLFIRLFLDGIAGWRFLFKGQLKHLWAILSAHYYFYLKLFYFLNKRKSKQYNNYYKIKSIVYNYYVKNGKVFDL